MTVLDASVFTGNGLVYCLVGAMAGAILLDVIALARIYVRKGRR